MRFAVLHLKCSSNRTGMRLLLFSGQLIEDGEVPILKRLAQKDLGKDLPSGVLLSVCILCVLFPASRRCPRRPSALHRKVID